MTDENKIHYRNSYGLSGEQLRSFDVFGFTLSEEVSVNKVNDKFMIFISGKNEMYVCLNNHPDGITVDQFTNELSRLHNLPNKGKNLFHKN